MNRFGSNLFLAALIVVTAIVIVQIAKQGNGPATPKAAIESAADDRAGGAVSDRPGDLVPRVIEPKSSAQDSAAISPVHVPESPAFGEPTPDPNHPVTPIPQPRDSGSAGEAERAETADSSPSFGGTFPIAAPFSPAPETADGSEVRSTPDATPDESQPSPPTKRIVTGPDDSFWSISENAYGSGIYYRALFRHNRKEVLRPDQLKAGTEIEIPPLETLRALYPQDFPEDEGGE